MTQQDDAAAIAAFIKQKGVTRCPTACAVPTHTAIAAADREALRRRADEKEARREARRQREGSLYRFGHAA